MCLRARFPSPLPLLAAVAGLLIGSAPAFAGYIGMPEPLAQRFVFQHGVDVDYTERTVNASRLTPDATFRNLRIVARETYGIYARGDMLINVSALYGVSRADIEFGAVNLGQTFWDTYAPGRGVAGVDVLSFGETFGASFGGSVRARLFRFRGKDISAGLQLLYSESADSGLPAMHLSYNEWDAFIGTAWKQRFISFYAGADMSWLIGELDLPDRSVDLDQKDLYGVFSGMSFRFYRHYTLMTELRAVNQLSIAAQVIYHF